MLYFTSDLHLGHANAITFTQRPFADVEEMDRMMDHMWEYAEVVVDDE